MNGFNRAVITVGALALAVLAFAVLLIPLPLLDGLQAGATFIRSQALIYPTPTRVIAIVVLLALLALVAAELFVRRPTLVPVRNTGHGSAMLDLRTVQKAVAQALSRSLEVKRGRSTVQGFTEGVAIYLNVELHATAHIADALAALHSLIREEVETRLGVPILTLKSTVAGTPYPGAASNGATNPDLATEPLWDVRELRRRLERTLLNQAGVADLEAVIGYHADGASLFLQLFVERDVILPAMIARAEHLARAIVEDDFRLAIYDLRVTAHAV